MSRTCGVYMICNRRNLGFYVGSSVDIETRWRSHKATMNNGTSPSVRLQRAWAKYGAESFDLVIVETCTPDVVTSREQHWLDDTRAVLLGYNCNHVARQGRLGRKHAPESIEKMKEAYRNGKKSGVRPKGIPCSEETKKRISEAKLIKSAERWANRPKRQLMLRMRADLPHPMLGKKHPPEAIEKMAAAKRGKVASQETRMKMSATRRGKKRGHYQTKESVE